MRIVVYGSKSFIINSVAALNLMVQANEALKRGNTAKAKALVAKAAAIEEQA